MTIATLIFLGLTVLSLSFFTIFYIKQNNLITKISLFSIFPFSGTLNILLLINYLPDSINVIFYTGITYFLLSISVVLFAFDTKTAIKITARITFLASILTWINLFASVSYIYKIPGIFTIILMIIYFGLFFTACIFSGKQKMQYYPTILIFFGIVSALHFFSTVSLCFGLSLNSIILFLGTSTFYLLIIYYLLDYTKYHFKHAKLIKLIFLFAAQTLTAYSNILLLK